MGLVVDEPDNPREIQPDLSTAWLEKAGLGGADLCETCLYKADLSQAGLSEAFLSYANLKGAIVTTDQLAQVRSLNGATTPDGASHE